MTSSSSPWGAIPHTGTGNAEGYMFFNAAEARTLDAMTARIMPSEPDGRGAREAITPQALISYDGAQSSRSSIVTSGNGSGWKVPFS